MRELELLKGEVEKRLSAPRFLHTVGVCDAAKRLAIELLPDRETDLIAAAYLHDIAKELPTDELISLSREYGYEPTSDDISSPQVLHAFAAPSVIKKDFPDYATDDILSSVFKHTTGDTQMSVFDEIIFISDYIEDGRKYPSCIEVREMLYENLRLAANIAKKEAALHKAVLKSIEYTLESLEKKHKTVNPKTLAAKTYFEEKIAGIVL